MAQNQLRSQVLGLQRQPENLKLYHEIIEKQLDDKFIEVVTNDNPKEGHYLPYHPVLKNSATTPLRIVFNCSPKTRQSSVSLNDCLQTGPSLTQRLYDVLLKFRIGTYTYTADISMALLRVGLQEEDRNYTKFLWIKDPIDPNSELITYRFVSVLFGATSSPFLLQATLDTHLKSNSPNKTEISKNLYVDNFQRTTSSESKLLNIYHEAYRELLGANMPLQSCVSNNAILNKLIATEFPDYQVPKRTKLLGIEWNTTTDQLTIKSVEPDTTNLTMIKLVSQVSKPFDPLRLLSTILINGKLIMQEYWQQKIGWDDLLTPALQEKWQGLVKDLSILESVKFPRNTVVNAKEPIKLHVFCDASGKAYGTVTYLISNGYDARVCPYPGPPPLPKEQVVLIRPFKTTGVDFTGALTLTGTKDQKPIKAYICLFTCATTRAVHLEVTPDMSAEAFLQAFHRFASCRSCPKLMISDNGSNLVAREACLRKIWTHSKVRTVLNQGQCHWKFIPPRAPWHGGFYERMIGTVKRSLRKTLHRQKIDLQELQTVAIEIEARVKDRPLTYLSDDALQREPLSPAHLMYGRQTPHPCVPYGRGTRGSFICPRE
ncbi:uncharacterized protein [Procambarus clarkii]|uniref:uncharacterized protein n=1 Tax=Procambarus clarkii TaxID=6728 RepID=UPI003742ADFC